MSIWSKELEKDLKWREAELASLKVEVVNAPKGSVRYEALLRALSAILYAHYEGFCKFAWAVYLDELKKAGIKRKDCKDEIAILSLEKKFNEIKNNFSSSSIWEFCQSGFHTLLEENIDFNIRLEAESNLSPDIFKENCLKAGLSCTLVDQYKTRLKSLLAKRNGIAHGEKMIIKHLAEYQEYEDAALEVMHDLAVSIIDSLENELYLKNP